MSEPSMTSNLPIRASRWLAGALAALLAPTIVCAQASLTPVERRITDAAIAADQQTYEAMQARLRAINAGGRPLRSYHLAKAQCWLDVSFHEYTRNDRGPFPQDALGQADQLAGGMERGQPPLNFDTPLISGAERLRPDLWAQAQALRSHAGWRCAQAKAACAEVELVHAGHEQAQYQWRHAKPYVQIAEDLLAEAQALAERCDPPPVVAAVAPVPVPVVVPPPAPVQLSASVVFSFDRHTAADIRAFSLAQLQALVARAKAEGLVAQRVQLAGHADRLNGTGHGDYNQRLSEKRAATVRAVLAEMGLPGLRDAQIGTEAFGDGRQVQACDGRFARTAELQECLLPNRRVEVIVTALPAPR
jgi:outer membrane protein OmpA-like peptidoglycan-associated protein